MFTRRTVANGLLSLEIGTETLCIPDVPEQFTYPPLCAFNSQDGWRWSRNGKLNKKSVLALKWKCYLCSHGKCKASIKADKHSFYVGADKGLNAQLVQTGIASHWSWLSIVQLVPAEDLAYSYCSLSLLCGWNLVSLGQNTATSNGYILCKGYKSLTRFSLKTYTIFKPHECHYKFL